MVVTARLVEVLTDVAASVRVKEAMEVTVGLVEPLVITEDLEEALLVAMKNTVLLVDDVTVFEEELEKHFGMGMLLNRMSGLEKGEIRRTTLYE
jgi:hypothetical protein